MRLTWLSNRSCYSAKLLAVTRACGGRPIPSTRGVFFHWYRRECSLKHLRAQDSCLSLGWLLLWGFPRPHFALMRNRNLCQEQRCILARSRRGSNPEFPTTSTSISRRQPRRKTTYGYVDPVRTPNPRARVSGQRRTHARSCEVPFSVSARIRNQTRQCATCRGLPGFEPGAPHNCHVGPACRTLDG